MRLLVTGAGGFVGATLVRHALAAGHEVTAVARSDAPRLAGLPVARADLRDAVAIRTLLEERRPQAVIHLAWAGVANSARFERTQITDNIEAACILVEASAAAGVEKFVGFGSQGEYGPLNRRISEADLPGPTTLYGAAKVAALQLTRQLAAQGGMAFAWMRLFSTYGPGDNPGWMIPSVIGQMLDGERPACTLGTQRWDYLYIEDVAGGALAAAVTTAAEGVFNLGSGQAVPVREVIELARDHAAPGMELVFGEVPFRPDQVMHMEADISRLQAATDWTPRVPLAEGVARTVAWHRNNR